jgi:hypothetical protein
MMGNYDDDWLIGNDIRGESGHGLFCGIIEGFILRK